MFDFVLGFAKVMTTSVSTATKAVLANLAGPASGFDATNPEDDAISEFAIGQEWFSGLGLVVRPLPPGKLNDGSPVHAEALAARAGDGLIPFAFRDLRLNAFYPSPKEGDVALVGYAGAFDSNSPTVDADGNPVSSERVIYVPYAFSGGVATKAHTIEIIGTAGNESISIIHGDGMAVTMASGGKHSVVMKNKAGDAYVEVNDDGNILNGNTVINGGATIGSPAGALPAAIAPKLAAYITQLETDIAAAITAVGAGGAANGATGAASFTGSAAGRATLVAAIPATKASVF